MVERIGNSILYLGDCKEIMRTLCEITACITDPPYGQNYKQKRSRDKLVRPDTEHAQIVGDDAPFDPSHLLHFDKLILWGGNWYADRLPSNGKWLVWDKREGTTPDDGADLEMAWTNLKGPSRMHRQLWRGICRRGEENVSKGAKKLHPNQKPVALTDWCLQQAGITEGDTVFDPYMGSCSLGVACKRRGINYIGVEIDPVHYATAVERMRNELLPLEAA
ncbi:MAG: DNA methyltransferase [Bacillota bacterium]